MKLDKMEKQQCAFKMHRYTWCAQSVVGRVISGALALTLAVWCMPFSSALAYADEAADAQQVVDNAQAELSRVEADMQGIESDRNALAQQVQDLQANIDNTTKDAQAAQSEVLRGRDQLSKSVQKQYRTGSVTSLMSMVIEADSFNDLLRNLEYASTIMQYQSGQVSLQKQRTDRFQTLLSDLNKQKDEQNQKITELDQKKAQADQLVSDATSKLKNAQAEQASRLADLQRKADEMAAQNNMNDQGISEDANTTDRQPVVPDYVPPQPDPAPAPSDDWTIGAASAYGGSTDPGTPNPGTTANGSRCDDFSMGVAVPMAWSNYRSYFGHSVEISYNGKTIIATINDCGYMAGGARSLDLQPGVWKAFGFSSCRDWGVRNVYYRIL